ncbi:TraR/DksA C4-type zinc finger protein [Leucobacter denitrificans]|uniref:TraR/DksA C4-type zinc finger protein n=2 Tax=Leucobacter denitrificans TaxID=683042 RepID=A0A7G9S7Q9_9MICO|nr:TraR/DksA C4-type zinc finger protein [Leucobacter denitrificans]
MLLGLRAEVSARVERIEAELHTLTLSRADANDDDEHDPEGVTLSTEWSRLTGLAAQARSDLAEVLAALERWDAGSYGVCTRCGLQIPPERLEVRPFAEHCVACASKSR